MYYTVYITVHSPFPSFIFVTLDHLSLPIGPPSQKQHIPREAAKTSPLNGTSRCGDLRSTNPIVDHGFFSHFRWFFGISEPPTVSTHFEFTLLKPGRKPHGFPSGHPISSPVPMPTSTGSRDNTRPNGVKANSKRGTEDETKPRGTTRKDRPSCQ